MISTHYIEIRNDNLKSTTGLYFWVLWGHTAAMTYRGEKYSGRGDPEANSKRQKSLGFLLKEAREELGWTQKQLAEATGIKIHSIIKYENIDKDGYGHYPKSQTLSKLCLALKIDPLQAMLACLPKEDFGMYEGLSNSQVWQYNHPQYQWVEKQLETVTKDLMLLRSFIEHFLPYIEKEKLPEHLHWLLEKGQKELDRISDLEARLLQMGVFILPMGSFLIPSGVTDDDGLEDFFDFGKPGVFEQEGMERTASIVERSLTFYARRFTQLAHQFEHREAEREKHAEMWRVFNGLKHAKSPEDDLPSPPSSNTTPTSEERQDSDD